MQYTSNLNLRKPESTDNVNIDDLNANMDIIDQKVGAQVVRTATVVVAASDASEESKAQADYVCDGIDDQIEIQAAIDSLTAGRTQFETVELVGNFNISGQITITENFTRLISMQGARLYLTDGSNITMLRIDANDVEINGIIFNGNKVNQTANCDGIELDTVERVTIKNCQFINFYRFAIAGGLSAGDYQNDLTVEGNYFSGSGDANIVNNPSGATAVESYGTIITRNICTGGKYLTGMGGTDNNVVVSNNYIVNTTQGGIDFYHVNRGVISNNTIKNCNHGIVLDGSSEISIVGNTVNNNTSRGININPNASRVTVIGNQMQGNGERGVVLGSSNEISFIGNILIDNSGGGIYVTSASKVTVTGNQVQGNGGMGVDAEFTSDLLVSQNVIQENTDWAIRVNDCDGAVFTGNKLKGTTTGTGSQYTIGLYKSDDVLFSENYLVVPTSGNLLRGIYVAGGTNVCNRVVIQNNILDSTGGTAVFDAGTDTVVRFNEFIGTGTAVSLNGTGAKVSHNIGYTTENSGTATITAGNTSVDVSHGLASTPTRVYLTPTTDTAGKRYWVSAKGSSTFTITIDSSHTADISFDWRAEV